MERNEAVACLDSEQVRGCVSQHGRYCKRYYKIWFTLANNNYKSTETAPK